MWSISPRVLVHNVTQKHFQKSFLQTHGGEDQSQQRPIQSEQNPACFLDKNCDDSEVHNYQVSSNHWPYYWRPGTLTTTPPCGMWWYVWLYYLMWFLLWARLDGSVGQIGRFCGPGWTHRPQVDNDYFKIYLLRLSNEAVSEWGLYVLIGQKTKVLNFL